MIAIVESRADRASVHVCEHLRDLADWEEREDESRPDAEGGGTYYRTDGAELRTFDDLHIELERPADAFERDPDLLVFASRHAGDTGALLTGHFTGNFGPAEYGGDDRALAKAAPNALVRLLEAFDTYAPEGYDVGMECTHHGPTEVGCPSLFAELGSGDEQWDDPAGAEAVARSILALHGVSPGRARTVVGFGGNHYVPRYERIVRETPWAVGHVASGWALEDAGLGADDDADRRAALEEHETVIARAFAASGAEHAVIEGTWPGLAETIADLGYRVVSETWLREVGDRSLEVVAAVESELGRVDEGVRFGDRREEAFAVVDLPADLIDAAEGIDPDRVRERLEAHAVAFETENGASRVGGRAALPEGDGAGGEDDADEDEDGPGALEAIVADLSAVLEEKYDDVRLEDGAVVAEVVGFDPELAREAGVPEGPKFGALASGSAVEVDGETVAPEDVRSRRTERFPLS
ncbi:D-aminoacyl-tRNA deacylase [Natrialbaceae archaeon GCM10025810]|uniref:D-aminoacyl-tRNA deacylase n=1 Tax=Halovalidus salilacus TaxID=3075124 RepID=UPI003616E031